MDILRYVDMVMQNGGDMGIWNLGDMKIWRYRDMEICGCVNLWVTKQGDNAAYIMKKFELKDYELMQ